MVLLKSLEFLKAVCFVIAAVVLAFWPERAIEAGVLLTAVVAILNLFGVYPELKARGLAKDLPKALRPKVK